jgi:hypothetical protein
MANRILGSVVGYMPRGRAAVADEFGGGDRWWWGVEGSVVGAGLAARARWWGRVWRLGPLVRI